MIAPGFKIFLSISVFTLNNAISKAQNVYSYKRIKIIHNIHIYVYLHTETIHTSGIGTTPEGGPPQ
jgi:hypothetical protein